MKLNYRILKVFLWSFIITALAGGMITVYFYYLSRIPDAINLKTCSEQEIDFCAPVSGIIMPEIVSTDGTAVDEQILPVDFSRKFTVVTGEQKNYVASLKLFGIIPYKEVAIRVVEEQMVIPMGITVGIYVETDGILVIDTGSFENCMGEECAPAEGILQKGDYILSVNGETVSRKRDFIERIEESKGASLELEIRREEQHLTVLVTPQQNVSGDYKLGVWVRDSAQGVGTLTYADLDGNYGALGHGIADTDTGVLMEMDRGELYRSQVVAIEKGQSGHPGEITGMIHYVHDNIIGTLEENTSLGVFGVMEPSALAEQAVWYPVEVAYRSEIHTGDAQILSNITGELKTYDIRIDNININSNDNKGLMITVTEPELLDITGGIVQGMSGSPILQDGKLIGAVTHVLVRDSTKGYGIFIENMLEH
ncbi:MAG: SpoIVB peptidase [Lachnospiraceae bacterium]